MDSDHLRLKWSVRRRWFCLQCQAVSRRDDDGARMGSIPWSTLQGAGTIAEARRLMDKRFAADAEPTTPGPLPPREEAKLVDRCPACSGDHDSDLGLSRTEKPAHTTVQWQDERAHDVRAAAAPHVTREHVYPWRQLATHPSSTTGFLLGARAWWELVATAIVRQIARRVRLHRWILQPVSKAFLLPKPPRATMESERMTQGGTGGKILRTSSTFRLPVLRPRERIAIALRRGRVRLTGCAGIHFSFSP